MSRIAIVTDSTAYLPDGYAQEHHVHILPLMVVSGDRSYLEGVDLSNDDFYCMLQAGQELPTTSQPGLGATATLFERLVADHYDEAVCIHLSSGISGTYATTVTAGGMIPGIKVQVFDSEISTMVQGFYVQEAVRMVEAGCDSQAVMAHLDALKRRMRAYFVVDDLNNLYKGGRLPKIASTVGGALQIKPILHFREGKIVPCELARTMRRAMSNIVERFESDAQCGQPMRAVLVHGHAPEEAAALMEEISARYPHVEVVISEIGPVIGTHLGAGSLGLGWYIK